MPMGCTVSRWASTRMPLPSPWLHSRRRLALQDVAEAVAARDALELQPEVAELALDVVDHLVDRLGVVARTLDRHPFDDAVQHFLGIDLRFVLAGFSHQTGSQVKYSGERFMSVK